MNKVTGIDDLFIYYADGRKEPTTFDRARMLVETCQEDIIFYNRMQAEIREEYIAATNTTAKLNSRSYSVRASVLADYMAEVGGKIAKTQVLLTQAETVLNISKRM